MVIEKMRMMPEHMLKCHAVMVELAVAYQTYSDVPCSCELYCQHLAGCAGLLHHAEPQYGEAARCYSDATC